MCLGKFHHGVKAEIELWHCPRVHCGAKAALCVAAVDPARCKTGFVGGQMVMEQAFRRVQHVARAKPDVGQIFQHVFKIAHGWLVGANVLCGVNAVKRNIQPGIAAAEGAGIDIGEDDQLEMLFQISQRFG